MAKGKALHVFVNLVEGSDDNDGSEEYPLKTIDKARKTMELRGRCTGIRVLGEAITASPCGTPQCGACTKANGRRLCPGHGCDRWISVSAKQHTECGWRKADEEHKTKPRGKETHFQPEDNHGFEKLKRKLLALAHQASVQYGWNGLIMGYAAKVGRGGSTARITYVSEDNGLYGIDDRGSIKVLPGLEENLSINADNALTLIRQKMSPSERSHLMPLKHDHEQQLMSEHHMGMAGVHGPGLSHGMEDKGHETPLPPELWLHMGAVGADKRGVVGLGDKSSLGMHPVSMMGLHSHMAGPSVDMSLPLDPSVAAAHVAALQAQAAAAAAAAVADDHKRKMAQLGAAGKRARSDE